MDFVARAGAVIDRSHRIAGMLLICVIVLGFMAACQFKQNRGLEAELNAKRIAYPVIVVPNAATGVYSPTEEDRLIQLFADYVSQSLNSFTPENVSNLLNDARKYMEPTLLVDSEPYFQKILRDTTADRRSSFFQPDRTRPIKVVKRTQNGEEMRDISMYGWLRLIVGGTVADAVPVQLDMTFHKVFASPSNPYGFMLSKYNVKTLVDLNQTPQLPGAQK